MSFELLLEELRRKSAQRVTACWRRAEHDAAALRQEAAKKVAEAKKLHERQLQDEERAVATPILRAAEIEALRIEDNACRELAERLQALALTEFALLRQQGYTTMFAGMVAELPEASWETVRVHPQDLGLARDHFSGVEILGDSSIGGGFIAESRGAEFRVNTTLALRLQKVWPFMLPRLLSDIRDEINATPAD